MKTNMLRSVTVLLTALMLSPAFAWREKAITVNQLPSVSQTILKKHFSKQRSVLVKQELEGLRTCYEVVFADGAKVEFDGEGQWKEIDMKYAAVPAALVPAQIRTFVKRNYPGTSIVQIERKRRGYDVKLSNRIEVEFDPLFRVRDIDA